MKAGDGLDAAPLGVPASAGITRRLMARAKTFNQTWELSFFDMH